MNTNQDIGMIGSWCVFRKPDTAYQYNYTTPETHEDIVKEMHVRNVFIHPTVLFRAELLHTVGYYPVKYQHVEDYAYFWQIIKHTRAAVLNQFLVTCEINESGISIKNRNTQLQGRYNVVSEFGTLPYRKLLGLMKLKALMLVPYKALLLLKRIKV
ncbi:hypothetical protein GCM10027443_01200 [Pontibacter brevis]